MMGPDTIRDASATATDATGRKRRIVHVTAVHTAIDIRIFQKECRSLVQRGYDVHLLAPDVPAASVDGVAMVGLRRYTSRFVRMSLGAFRAFRAARRLHADLYHFHDPELLPWGQLLRLMGRKVVFDMHEHLPGAILNKGWLPRLLRRPIALAVIVLEWMLLTGMPVIFAEDSYVKHYSRSRKSAVVLNMPLLDELKAVRPVIQPGPTIAYFGAVSPLRGTLVLLDAVKILMDQGIPVGLELIGPVPDDHRREIGDRVRTYRLERVNVRGYMEAHRGWEIVAGCTLGTALLAPIANYKESYPTKIFEYMCLGLPVLASDFPLYRTIVEDLHCGYCIDPQDPRRVAQAIKQLLDDPALARMLGENGRVAVNARFNWVNEFRKLEGLYDAILQSGA